MIGNPPFEFGEVSIKNQAWRKFLLDLQALLNEVSGNGPVLIYTADEHLPSAFNLATLASGYLKQTVSIGIAVPSTVTFVPQSDLRWSPVVKTFADSGYTASAGEFVSVNATGGVTTITLPASPADGASVIVKKLDASGNAVTVGGGGHNIDGAATDSLAAQWNSAIYVWSAAANSWLIAGQV